MVRVPGYVFVSHASEDRPYADRLAGAMRSNGLDVWMYSTTAGDKWYDELEARLDNSAVVVLIMSRSGRSSEWVLNEILRAQRKGIPVRPLLVDGDVWLALEAQQVIEVQQGQLPAADFYLDLKRLVSGAGSERPLAPAGAVARSMTVFDGKDPRDVVRLNIQSRVEALRGRKGPGSDVPRVYVAVGAGAGDFFVISRLHYRKRFRASLFLESGRYDEASIGGFEEHGWAKPPRGAFAPGIYEYPRRLVKVEEYSSLCPAADAHDVAQAVTSAAIDVLGEVPGLVTPLPAPMA